MSQFGPGYDMSRKHSFFKRRGGHLKKATRVKKPKKKKNKKKTPFSQLFHQNTHLWWITAFTLSLNQSCHRLPQRQTSQRSTELGQEIPTATTETVASTQSRSKMYLRQMHAHTHTHRREKTKAQRQVLKVELFSKKSLFFLTYRMNQQISGIHTYLNI